MPDLQHALTLWRGGSRDAAEREVLAVLGEVPDDLMALQFLADVYTANGRGGDAVTIRRRVCAAVPANAAALRQLAQALMSEGVATEAIDVLRRALLIEPGNARAHNNLGLAQLRSGEVIGAVASLQRAVTIDPRYALAHMNLGVALRQSGQRDSARVSLECALQTDPYLTQASVYLSEILRETDAAAARAEEDRALESLAVNLMTTRRHEEAQRAWAQLITRSAALDFLHGTRFHCALHCCDWSGYVEGAERIHADVMQGHCIDRPFSFFVHSPSAAAQLVCAKTFAAKYFPAHTPPEPTKPPAQSTLTPRSANPSRQRIKIAYASFDFHEHATAYLIAGLLENHERTDFEITLLSYGKSDGSPMRQRLEQAVERFVDVQQYTDAEVIDLARRLSIDIAVDLKGHTGGARTGIFAGRAAPLQINYLGFPGTLGAPYYDYIIADREVIPPSDYVNYSETVITLPRCYQPNDAARPLPAHAPPRAAFGLPQTGFVFCSFNNLYKITPAVFEVWLSLLREVNGAVLWLLEGTSAAMRNLRDSASRQGIDPSRLVFAAHIELAQHLARYRHADLFLDTTPCNAHTTASDALWMAVPIVTVTGTTFAGRVATSLLKSVDLERLCTGTLADYRRLALRLATQPNELEELKRHLDQGRANFSLFDTVQYCRDLESAYRVIHARHQCGQRPYPVCV